ncbi:MAG: hypothetical protein NTX17_01695 [Candidatus Eisenbacteria bacterium]|nr:hypothetical protein [Candidatus Eisenbacteria bacterium]
MRLSSARGRRTPVFSRLARLLSPLVSPLVLSWISLLLLILVASQPREVRADSATWWNYSYGYRQQLTISNNSTSVLPAGYSVSLSLDHFSLVEAGKSLANGNDVRIVYWNGSTHTELDRVNELGWNTAGTNAQIWFRIQADIVGSGTDDGYFLYYGNRDAGAPPADRKNVYEFFDNFSDYDTRQYDTSVPGTTDVIGNGDEQAWKVQSGTWNIENDAQADGTTGKVLSSDCVSGLYDYAYVLNKNYDNVLVEVKMRTKSGENGGYWPFGARLDTLTGANYTAWSYATYSKMFRYSSWSSPTALVTGTTRSGMSNNWHTLRFTLDGTKLNLYFDGVSYGCYVEDATLTSGTIFAVGSASRKMHFDDFKVRKYVTDEPSVLAAAEEEGLARPIVSLNKKWRLKGDLHTPTDQYVSFSVSFPEGEGMTEAQGSYEILEADLSGALSRTGPTSWEGQADISGLETGTFHLVVTIGDATQQSSSDPAVFRISYPFYHVWTIDWEGGYVPTFPYLDSLAALADEHEMPVCQFFNPRIYVYPYLAEWQRAQMTQWVLQRAQTRGDEIGLHLHMYADYVEAVGITPIMSPHWANHSDGYDVPFAAYDYEQSLALLDLAVSLFQAKGLGTPSSFRAGGWFADEENLQALCEREFLIDASGCISSTTGSLPNLWSLGVTSQPYHPCPEDKNTSSCQPEDANLVLLETPNNLGVTSGTVDRRPYFNANYSGAPLASVRVGVLLSHATSATGAEGAMIEQYFAHVDSFLYAADKGAVVYVTLADVREALSVLPLEPPDFLGPPDLVSGELIQQIGESFTFRIYEPDSLELVKYRIQISQAPDYDYDTGMVVDYVSGLDPQGTFGFAVGQSESTGTYHRGAEWQSLSPGSYYWRVMAIDSEGHYSRWSLARDGNVAFMIEQPEGVEGGQNASPVPLAVSFCNPSGPSVFLKAQVPVAGKATLRIFNCSGRLVRTLPLDGLSAGASGHYWDGKNSEGLSVSSGVYLVELSQSGRAVTKKLVLVK